MKTFFFFSLRRFLAEKIGICGRFGNLATSSSQQQRAYFLEWTGGNRAYRLGRLKPRASEKMEDLITNNKDLFFSSPILSVENRTSEDWYRYTFFFAFQYTDIFSENRTSEEVKTFFCSSNQRDQIA